MPYEIKFFISLVGTLIIEVPLVFVMVRYLFKQKSLKWHEPVVISCIASILTLPYLWFVLPSFIDTNYLLIGEFSVTLIEGILYSYLLKIRIDKAFAISIIANAASYLLGKFLLDLIF